MWKLSEDNWRSSINRRFLIQNLQQYKKKGVSLFLKMKLGLRSGSLNLKMQSNLRILFHQGL